MRFKATLFISFRIIDNKLPYNCFLEFSKTRLYYPNNSNIVWEESHLRNGIPYTLIVHDESERKFKYEIRVESSRLLRLQVSKKNEIKLKWIHGMFRFQKEPLAFIAIILSILTLLATIVLGVLNLKCK